MGRIRASVVARVLANQRNAALRANAEWKAYALNLEATLEERPVSLPDMHPLIRDRCTALFHNGHYEEALSNAVKCVEVALRQAIGADESRYGVQLATDAFASRPPALRVSDNEAEQEGCHLLFRGFFGFVRNAVMHRFLDAESADIYAFERLAFASCLLRIIEAANQPPGHGASTQ